MTVFDPGQGADRAEVWHRILSARDGDVAHCETYRLFTGVNREGAHSIATGRYIDRLERRGGRWAIAYRECIREMSGDVAPSVVAQTRSVTLFATAPSRRDPGDVFDLRPWEAAPAIRAVAQVECVPWRQRHRPTRC